MTKFYLLLWCFALILLPLVGHGQKNNRPPISGDYEANKLMVKFKTQATSTSAQGRSAAMTLQGVSIIEQEPFLRAQPNSKQQSQTKQIRDIHGLSRIYKITYSAKKSIEAVIDELMQTGEFEYVEPAYIFHSTAVPNDPGYAAQWALPQVFAPQAWDIQANADGQIIAIIDSGSEVNHPDLAANILLNSADPIDGVDNDGDGYVDNYYGWDFIGAFAGAGGDNDPNVINAANDHGVHVSGIASAVTNNATGVASIAQSAKLLILKAAADDNKDDIYTTAAFDALMYAIQKGAKIINCSWGRDGGASAFEQNIVNEAIDQGCLIVAAAGNSGTDIPEYPAAYEGVLAIANLDANDTKSGTSSYGYHVALSAPGTSIYSTTYGQSYGYKTGTSMSTPMVASAAALVAARFPTYSGEQIGEILRASADDIYSLSGNATYINQLGSGRLNVLKALQADHLPGIRKQEIEITDASGAFDDGDTISVRFLLKNLLQPATNLQLFLKSDDSRVEILDSQVDFGNFNTNDEKWTPEMRIHIKEGIAENVEVVFRLDYSSTAENYQSSEYFSLVLNRDFINYQNGDIETTITSVGRLGYQDASTVHGNGWKYKGQSLLYEASLMISAYGDKIVNNTRTSDGHAAEDFVKLHGATQESDSLASFKAFSVFNDANSPQPLDLQITHRHYAFAEAEPFVIVEYDITNSGSSTLNDVYVGMFSDWDIGDGTKNFTKYLGDLRTSYTTSATDASQPYAGVKLLNNDSKSHYYPLSYNVQGNFLSDDDFTDTEKIASLSSGITATGLGQNLGGVDVMNVSASGPYNLAPGESKTVSFAFLSGDNLDELKNVAQAAQETFRQITAVKEDLSDFKAPKVYPNPSHVADGFATLELVLPKYGHLRVEVYNSVGKKMSTVINQGYVAGLHRISVPVSELSAGVYFISAYFNGDRKSTKLLVLE